MFGQDLGEAFYHDEPLRGVLLQHFALLDLPSLILQLVKQIVEILTRIYHQLLDLHNQQL